MLRYLYQFSIVVPTLLLCCFSPSLLQAQGDPDCVNSIVLCSNADITFNPSGIGMINDFASTANSQGCLSSGERNTAWYFFAFNPNMPANSQIEFTITPSFPADYDFAVYGPDVNCNGLGSPIRCSYAAGNGPTGLGNGATDNSEGAGGNGWVAPLTVQPGQGFYLVIDNFSGNGAGFNMSWGGSAAPYLDCSANPNCNIQANYAPTYTACQSGASFVFQGAIFGLTPGIPVDYVWDSPNGIGFLNNPFSANPTFFPPSDQFGTFTYTLTITQETCEQTATVSVTILPPPNVIITGPAAVCIGGQITLSATPGYNSYTWSTGASGPNATINAPGSYSVTVTNSNGCQGMATYFVDAINPPMPQITGPTDVCPNTTAVLDAGFGYSSYQWSTGSTNQVTLISNPGTYSVTVVQNGCVGVAQYTVFATPPPTVSIDGEPFTCFGETTTLSATPGFNTYLWSNGTAGPSITATNSGTYSITAVDAEGCVATASFVLTQAPPITPSISGNLTVCNGSSATLNVSGTYSNYAWSNGDSGPSINVDQAGAYTVTVTGQFGCTGTATANVSSIPDPVPVISGNTSFCVGSSTTLTASSGFAGYLWSTGSNSTSIQVNQPGQYSVIVSTAAGCLGEASIQVVENPRPSPAISGPSEICPGTAATLDAGAGYSNYVWSNGQGGQSITVSNQANYQVTVTDANGCQGSASWALGVLPAPTPSITGATTFCEGTSTTLNTGNGFASYNWSNGGNQASISVSQAGPYSVTVTDNSGCTGTASTNVSSIPNPVPSITAPPLFCQGSTAALQASPGFSSYTWSTGNTGSNLSVDTPGDYSVTVSNTAGCQGSATVSISQAPLPNVSIDGPLSFCTNSATTLSSSSNFASYLWSTGSNEPLISVNQAGSYGLTVTDANGCSNAASVVVNEVPSLQPQIIGNLQYCAGSATALDAGSGYASYAWSNGSNAQGINVNTPGTFSVTVTDANGCSGSGSVSVTENALPVFSINGTPSFCAGSSASLSGTPGFATYQWSNNASTADINVDMPGNYSLTVSDNNGCSNTASINVTEFPLPTPSILGELSFCPEGSTTLGLASSYPQYNWSNGSSNPAITIITPGNYSVTVTDANGCSAASTVATSLFSSPQPQISGALAYCQGSSTTLQADAGYASYTWSNGATGPSLTVNQPGTLNLTVVDGNGCQGTTSVAVTQNALPQPVITGIDFFCDGTSTTLDAGPGYQAYAWTGSSSGQQLTVNQAGNYSVTVTDAAGCQGSTSLQVSAIPAPTPQISGALNFCPGTSTELSTGGNFSSYAWSTGNTGTLIEVSLPGNYGLTVTDAFGCPGSTSVVVASFPANVPAISGNLNYCPGENTLLTAAGGFSDYIWSTGELGASITVSSNGNYSLSATDNNGCSVANAVTVTAHQVDTPAISGDNAFCQGGSALLEATPGFAAYLWSNGVQGPAITASTAGAYQVTTTDTNGCTTANSIQVTVYPLPQVAIGGSTSFCIGGSTTLNAGAAYSQYLWSNGSTSPSIQVGLADVYGLTVTDANGCVNSAAVEVFEDIELNPVISGPPAYCPGLSTTLDAGEGFQTYTWSNGATSQSLLVDAPGNYSVTVTDAFGCTGDAVLTVNEYPAPMPSIQGALSYCAGASTSLAAAGGPFALYNWSTGATAPQIVASQPGTYSLTITDSNGCQESVLADVAENPLPAFSINGPLSFCQGDTTTLTATPGFATYQWSNGQQTAEIAVATPGSYGVTVANSFGCTSQQAVTTTQIAQPQADAGSPREINCFYPEVSLGGSGSSQGSTIQYQWQGPGIDASNANQQFPAVDVAGTYVLTVINTPLGCASVPATVIVEDNTALPAVVLQALDVLDCVTASVIIDGTDSESGSNISYQWFNADMTLISGAQSPTLSVSSAGNFFLLVTNSTSGCTALGSALVEENYTYPNAEAGSPRHLDCDTPTVALGGNASPAPAISYNWTTPDGSILSGAQSLAPVVNQPGLYILTVLDTSNGCASLDTVRVTQDINLPQVDAGLPQEIDCLNPNATLDGSGSVIGSQFTYQWALGSIDNVVGTGLSLTVDQAGLYILIVTNTDNGCTNTRSVMVSQNSAQPTALNLSYDIPTCFGDQDGSLLVEGVEGGTPPFLYSFNGQPLSPQLLFNNLAAGTYPIIVQDATGCEFRIDAVLPDGNDLMVDLGADITIKLGQEARLEAIVNIPLSEIATISWSASDSLSCYDCLTPVAYPTASGAYYLRVTDINGCSAEDRLTLFLDKQRRLFVPNVFSPNGDGNNDIFMAFAGPEVVRLRSFQVFNRWGEPVFEAYGATPNNPAHGWDGSFRGQALNNAVFVWLAEVEFVDGVVELFKGDVTLLR